MKITLVLLFIFLCLLCFGQNSSRDSAQKNTNFTIYNEIRKKWKDVTIVPKQGFVPDEKTAIKIAEAIWYPIYGDEIFDEKPYKAELKNNIWIVRGTLNHDVGGVAYIEIQKSDCKILKVTHGK